MINKGTRPHYVSQVSPSLFTELSESYLFENDRTKSNGLYDDDISISSTLNKEILDHQIDDRVIIKSEEGQANPREGHNFSKYRTEFNNVTKEFWRASGPDIWIMALDERRSLYNNFFKHHIKFCDQRIINLQKDAILEEE